MLIVLEEVKKEPLCAAGVGAEQNPSEEHFLVHEDNVHCASQGRPVTMNMMLERAGCPEPGEQLVTMTKISGESKLTKQML